MEKRIEKESSNCFGAAAQRGINLQPARQVFWSSIVYSTKLNFTLVFLILFLVFILLNNYLVLLFHSSEEMESSML